MSVHSILAAYPLVLSPMRIRLKYRSRNYHDGLADRRSEPGTEAVRGGRAARAIGIDTTVINRAAGACSGRVAGAAAPARAAPARARAVPGTAALARAAWVRATAPGARAVARVSVGAVAGRAWAASAAAAPGRGPGGRGPAAAWAVAPGPAALDAAR